MRELMRNWQQFSPPAGLAHTLEDGQVQRLDAAPRVRGIWVMQGRLWITGLATEARGGDLWLEAGDLVIVPPGHRPVLEAARSHASRGAVPPTAFVCAELPEGRTSGAATIRRLVAALGAGLLPALSHLPDRCLPPRYRLSPPSSSCMGGAWGLPSGPR